MKQEFDDLRKELKQMKVLLFLLFIYFTQEVEKELETKSIHHDNELSALKADQEMCLMNLSLL